MTEGLPTIELALLLGLRHGLVPDHLAAIDGLTMRASPAAAPWMGAVFAVGHGVVMLLMVALAGSVSRWLHPEHTLLSGLDLLEWLPGILLLCLGALNAHGLMRPPSTRRAGSIAARLLAPFASARPVTALGIGMLFALGIETLLQAIAWGYAGASLGDHSWTALQAAAAFVLGMAITDTLDGYVTARISASAGPSAILRFRRRIGWPIVILCVVSGTQLLAAKACASCVPAEHWMELLGMGMVGLTLMIYAVTWLRNMPSSV